MKSDNFEWMRPRLPRTTPSTASVSNWQPNKDPFAIERLDDREDYGEERFILIGSAPGSILTVIYAERNGRIRIISARQATKREQDDYFTESE
jgi:hypothetical protein